MKISEKNFKANRRGFNRQKPQMTLKPVPIFGRFKVTSSIVITMNLSFNSTGRRKKHSLFYSSGCATRKEDSDYWSVDSSKHLSDSWRGFTRFTLLKENPPKGYMWSGWRMTKKQAAPRTRSCMSRRLDENWVKPHGTEKNKNGEKKSQNLTMLGN